MKKKCVWMRYDNKLLTMKTIFKNYSKILTLSAIMIFAWSCEKDEASAALTSDQRVESAELQVILETDDFSSAADTALINAFQQNVSGKSGRGFDCYTADYSNTGYTLVFDDCSVEDGGAKLNGTLTVVYEIGNEASAFTATYTDLSVGDITINGTRAFNINGNDANISFTIVSDMTITMADESVLEESGTKTISLEFGSTQLFDVEVSIEGNWTVINDGNTYVINVTSALISSLACDYIDTGVMSLTKNGLAVTVDFGDGSCDNIATVIYPDGTEEEISLDD